jgi:esterase/lipase
VERRGFFTNRRGRRLFYAYHGEPGRFTWIFCNPMLEEKINAHPVYVGLARNFAQNNASVIRFDYEGDGDSEGELASVGVEQWVNDAQDMARFAQTEFGATALGFFGIRLGGAIATLAAEGLACKQILIWEPIINGQSYFQDCLKSNLATQFSLYKKIVENRDQLIEKLNAGGSINVLGYELGKTMCDSLQKIDLVQTLQHIHFPVFILGSLRPETGKPLTPAFANLSETKEIKIQMIETIAFWNESKSYQPQPDSFVQPSLKILADLDVIH